MWRSKSTPGVILVVGYVSIVLQCSFLYSIGWLSSQDSAIICIVLAPIFSFYGVPLLHSYFKRKAARQPPVEQGASDEVSLYVSLASLIYVVGTLVMVLVYGFYPALFGGVTSLIGSLALLETIVGAVIGLGARP